MNTLRKRAAALTVAALSLVGVGFALPALAAPTPTPGTTASITEAVTKVIDDVKANPDLTDQQKQDALATLEEKLADLEAVQPPADDTNAKADVAAKNADAAKQAQSRGKTSDAFDLAAFDEPGIYPKDAPAPASEFIDTNYLSQNLDGAHYAVYAGANGSDDLKTGAVRILRHSATDPDGVTTTLTLAGTGALEVTAFDGAHVSLVDSQGAAHKLDLAALTLS